MKPISCCLILGIWLCFVPLVWADSDWNAGIHEDGYGFYLSSPDSRFSLGIMGYGQFLGSAYFEEYHNNRARTDVPLGFSVRRARVDLAGSVYGKFDYLLEMGTPTLRPYPSAAGSDFGVVEARLTASLAENALNLRIGKFVVPFSSENSRSSRRLEAIERCSILNSLFASSILDVQTGLMMFGQFFNGGFNYYLVAVNGNGNSSISSEFDDDGYKEIQLKIVFAPHQVIHLGFAYDTNRNSGQAVSLLDHAFMTYVSGLVTGTRHGGQLNLDIQADWFTFRTEWLGLYYMDSEENDAVVSMLMGSYAHLGFMLTGDEKDGFGILLRGEWERMDWSGDENEYDLISFIAGWNWYFNPSVRWQLNYIVELPARATGVGVYASAKVKHMLLNEIQVKF